MAEFESGYCTGCGYPAGKGGLLQGVHRPYCWRKVTMVLGIEETNVIIAKCLTEMSRHWRLFSWFVERREHTYFQPGQAWVVEDSEKRLSKP